jgi:site-specific DNA recombinase
VFVAEFTAEWNRLRAEAEGAVAPRRRELEAVRRKLAGLVEAIADGLRAPGLQGRLDELEGRRAVLEAEVAAAEAAPALPRLHPNLSEVYRERVARLRAGLAVGGVGGPEVLEAARALIERVEVHPPPAGPGGPPRLELVGELSAMLEAAGLAMAGIGKDPRLGACGPDLFGGSVEVGAGAGFEPAAFRF